MKHILIIDDNKSNLVAARSALTDVYKTTAVTSGAQALKFLENNKPDLMLLDINMPEMDGFEVMNRVRELPNGIDLPIIFLTADSDSDTESKCLELGALDFISKPFVPIVMRSRIARTLELEELRSNLATKLDEKIIEVSEMKSKSCQDALTGLWNRAYTEESANRLLGENKKGALFMIDMDNFKAINDNYGHMAGDHTLKMFAETLRKYAAPEDIVCRIGGDEFVTFVADNSSKSVLSNHASDIISDLCRKIKECKFETNSSVSIGIAQCPDDGTDFASLYNAADKALYYVKQNGKNSYHFYSDQSLAETSRSATNVDVRYLREVMSRNDSGTGSYLMDYDSFHHVYNFIRRTVERCHRDVQTLLFTLEAANDKIDPVELSVAGEMLEQAIYTSLRRVDVSTRYSSKQIIVILLDSNTENGRVVAQRIIDCFRKIYKGEIQIDYNIVQMEDGGSAAFAVNP